uniref:Uncharacterized protein n=1 Tax=Scleropages formosus TaxID=113540 RepID=A0A8C9T8Q2_SCLFO
MSSSSAALLNQQFVNPNRSLVPLWNKLAARFYSGVVCRLSWALDAQRCAGERYTGSRRAAGNPGANRARTPQIGMRVSRPHRISSLLLQEDCVPAAMQCYLLELEVIMFEKDVEDKDENIKLRKNSSSCLPCEAHQEGNSTVFLDRFKQFLQRVLSDA